MVQKANAGTGSPVPVGTGERVVQDGECVIGIAYETGHFWETIWNHPDNAELKTKRGSPHVLLPEDRIHVPPIEIKEEAGATEKRHQFQRKGIAINVEFKVCEDGTPLAGEPYLLVIEGRHKSGKVPNDGIITAPMLPSDQRGRLKVGKEPNERLYELRFGCLDPGHSRSGAADRLQNMGYIGATSDDALFAESLKEFQADQKLKITGSLDDDTAKALVQKHGS